MGTDHTSGEAVAGEVGFCRACGGELRWRTPAGEGHRRRVCAGCGAIDYRQPKLAAGVILERDGRVLLTRRSIEPYVGLWCLPAGFLEEDEGTAACAIRETLEETGLEVSLRGVFDVHDYTDDPRGRGTLILYDGAIVGGRERAGDDADRVEWIPIETLDETMIAFEQHRLAIRKLRDRSQGGGTHGARS